jgi:hypothetical protein
MVPGLLDEATLDGAYGILRRFGPPRMALFVDRTSVADAHAAIEEACQAWGGASSLLLPVERGAAALDSVWHAILDMSIVDFFMDRGVAPDLAERLNKTTPSLFGPGTRASLLPTLASLKDDTRRWNPVVVPRLEPTDPWRLAYAVVLGAWPDMPDTKEFDHLGLRTDVSFSDFVQCRFETVAEPGPRNLLDRLRDARTLTPVAISIANLERRQVTGTLISGNDVLPGQFPVARAVGPSVVVIYEPGSVEDLCLLWNLRWTYGLPFGAPLGVPLASGSDVQHAIRSWMEQTAIFGLNLSGSYFALSSRSVAAEVLQGIAEEIPWGDWRVEAPEALFIPSDRSTRSTSDVAVFTKGWARLPAWHAVDSGAFHLTRQIAISMRPVVRFEIEGQHVPSFELEGIYQLEGACRGGGVEVPARQPTDMATLSWPSGWDVVAGLLRRHGLVAQPSGSGRIAAGFLRRAGSIPGIRPLLSASVIGLLYDLAERRGTARFKRQIRELASEIATSVETPEEQLNRIEERLAALTLPGSEEERSDVTFDHIIGRLGDSKAAKAWLRWGERSGLVLRGLVLRCEECRRKDWSPIGDLAPPWTCRWCGAQLRQPFPAGQVPFRYAASSTTLSLVGEDAISHLLALRWFYDLFSGDRKVLYGAYPGVTIRRAGSTKDIGEADVLLVFSNGWLVPGEVKLRSSGWSAEDVWKLDILTEALDAPWSFVATPQWAEECSDAWRKAAVEGPRPRFALTGEHLFERSVLWRLGDNPFSWRADTVQDHEARRDEFNEYLPELVSALEATE